jgi:hypothetical protein
MKLNFQIPIKASPEMVFSYLDDDTKSMLWSGSMGERVYLTSRGPTSAAGRKFRQKFKELGKWGELDGEIVLHQCPERVCVHIGTRQFTLAIDYRLNTTTHGTDLEYTVELIQASRLAQTMSAIFSKFARGILHQQILKMKDLAEAEAARGASPSEFKKT